MLTQRSSPNRPLGESIDPRRFELARTLQQSDSFYHTNHLTNILFNFKMGIKSIMQFFNYARVFDKLAHVGVIAP